MDQEADDSAWVSGPASTSTGSSSSSVGDATSSSTGSSSSSVGSVLFGGEGQEQSETNPGTTSSVSSSESSAGGPVDSGPRDNSPGAPATDAENDMMSMVTAIAGMAPGLPGQLATITGEAINNTTAAAKPDSDTYHDDKTIQSINSGLAAASLLGIEAAGPLGVVAAGASAIGHGAQAVGKGMIEGGLANNPGQTGTGDEGWPH